MQPVKRGRKPNATPSIKVEPSLDEATVASLDALIVGGYGKSRADVARYLILREIDDLKRCESFLQHTPSQIMVQKQRTRTGPVA